MEYALLIGTGIFGGVIAGMLGLGGGIFYILVLPSIIAWRKTAGCSGFPFLISFDL